MKEIVEVGRADDDHLYIQGDGLRPEALRGGEPKHLSGVLDADLPRLKCDLQCLPTDPEPQQVGRGQDEVAAVGAMEGSGANLGEVGGDHAELDPPFHRTKQVGISGVLLHYHRGSLQAGVIHDHVYPVALVWIACSGDRDRQSGLLARSLKILDVLYDVGLGFLEE